MAKPMNLAVTEIYKSKDGWIHKAGLPKVEWVYNIPRNWHKHAYEVGKDRFPHTKLKLMHQINDKHGKYIEIEITEFLYKGILHETLWDKYKRTDLEAIEDNVPW